MNIIDKFIGIFSPRRAYERMMWRSMTGYNAAEPRNASAGWRPVDGTAEGINERSRHVICMKARDLERNSDVTAAIVTAYERNVVGEGFRVQANTGDDDLNNRLEELFKDWSRPANCDISGRQSFTEMCTMAVRRMVVDGGMLFIKVTDKGAPVPFKLQAREVTDLDTTTIQAPRAGGNDLVNGIEIDSYNKPIAYHLLKVTPAGWLDYEAERVEADRVLALWQLHRPSQIREVSPLSVSLNRQEDADDYLATVGIKEKVLACLAVFIKRFTPGGTALGRGTSAVDDKTGYQKTKLAPGMIETLQPGDEVQSVVPTGQASNARELMTLYTRLIGAGQGLSYEAVSRDMSQVNYSSARQGALEDRKTYRRLQNYLIEHLLTDVYEEVITAAVLSGELHIPDFFKNKRKYLRHTWTAPGWAWIDPVKEVNANANAINTGQETLATVCAKNGTDWEEMLEQRAKELAKVKELEEAYDIEIFKPLSEGGKDEEPKEDGRN